MEGEVRGLKIVLEGIRPISKKNSKRLIPVRGRIIPISSKAYLQFEKDALLVIRPQLPPLFAPFSGPVHVDYVFHLKGKLGLDIDNAIAGINDILEKAGIVLNDEQIGEGTFKRIKGCNDWRTELDIREVDQENG